LRKIKEHSNFAHIQEHITQLLKDCVWI